MAPTRGSRMLSGLDPDHNVIDDTAYATVEHLIVDDAPPKHTTRSARNGRAEYHPMDAVTRPNMPATQRHRSKSVSFADELEDDSDIESLQSSSQTISDSDRPDDDATAEPVSRRGPPPATRKKDSRASRHSSRKEAQKFVDYDRKSHPSDYGIPGYKHRAKFTPPVEKGSTSQIPRKRKAASPDSDDDQAPVQPRHPRKKLKTLGTAAGATTTAKRGRGRPRKKQNASDEVNALVEAAIRGSQRALILLSSPTGSDDLEHDIALAFGPPIESASDTRHSSNTLNVSPEECTPSDLAPSHRFPEYIFDRHALQNGAVPLSTDAAYAMLLEDFRSDHDAQMVIVKPYNVAACDAVAPYDGETSKSGAASPEHSTTTDGREVPDSASPSEDEDDGSEDYSSQNHFNEAIAITEPRDDSSGSDDSVLQHLEPLSSERVDTLGQ